MRQARLHRIKRQAVLGLALTVAIIILEHISEYFSPVRAALEYSSDWLQTRLAPVQNPRDKIVVVDLSDQHLVPNPVNPGGEAYTPRQALRTIVEGILEHQHPAAIGIDVDFSLTESGDFFNPEDPDFLDFLADYQGMDGKLFVGVSTGLEKGPSKGLGNEKYRDLAAYVVRPRAEGYGPNPRMDERVTIPYISEAGERQIWRVPSLAAALASKLSAPKEPARYLKWAIERRKEESDRGVVYDQFLVDFSPIDHFSEHAILSHEVGDRKENELKNKIVILGRGTRGLSSPANDTFSVPGHLHSEYPGVLLHACAAYTLLGATLWHLTEPGRVVLDLLFASAVFGVVAFIAWFYNTRVRADVAVHRLGKLLTWVSVIAVLFVGQSLINLTRIMWPDYLLVAAGLLLHSSLEQPDNPLRVMTHALRRGWRTVAFGPTDKGHSQ